MKLNRVQVDNNQDRRGSGYVKVYREWDMRSKAERTKAYTPGYNQTQGQTGSMLQRWQQETMLDQPYNNLQAVKKRADLTNDKQVSERDDRNSSLGYFDPHARPE